jgi:hypothetical protein
MTFGGEIKRMEVTPNPCIFDRENLQRFLHELHNKVHRFISFSMEISEKKNDVTFVTDGHLLSVIIIVAKLPG